MLALQNKYFHYIDYCITVIQSYIREAPELGTDLRINKSLSKELENEVKENGFDILHSPLSNTITVYLAKDSKVKLKFEEPQACDPKWDEIPSESFIVSTI